MPVNASPPAGERQFSRPVKIIVLIVMPLIFVTLFIFTYVSAQHAPAPRELPLVVAGSSQVTEDVASQIEEQSPSGFDIIQTSSADDAQLQVETRAADGAIIIDEQNVTTIVANAGSRLAANLVGRVGDQVADGLGGTNTVADVAPLSDGDVGGVAPFYFLVACTVCAFLAIQGVSQAFQRPRMRTMLLVNLGITLVVPILSFSVISLVVGDFGVSFASVAAVIGIGMLNALTVGLLSSVLTRLVGAAGTILIPVLFIAFNLPAAGGSIPASMLPAFWQPLHEVMLGAGAMEAMRGLLFFDGAQVGRWMVQILIWFGAAVVLTVVVARHTRTKPPREETEVERLSDAASESAALATL